MSHTFRILRHQTLFEFLALFCVMFLHIFIPFTVNNRTHDGRVTMTTESSKRRCNNIVSYEFLRMRRTCDYIELNAYYCVLFNSRDRIRDRIGFSVWLVSGYAHVFVLHFVVAVISGLQHSKNWRERMSLVRCMSLKKPNATVICPQFSWCF